jgi:crotonobetainyl-CoA:carnitine CoA-transferase CaiB-like acyl-CoA transferase
MSATPGAEGQGRLPLAGLRVLDYAQYVAGPFATMLLADLGAEVIKVEPPRGDAWRHYEPITADGGTWFFALNRNKQSVVADLKTDDGRALSRALIRSADVVVHNMPPSRAAAFGLDREAVLEVNPRAVWACVSAFGSEGPMAGTLGYDLIAQAASGLLLADVREDDEVPRRSGGIAMADLTAGLLTLSSVLAGLTDRFRHESEDLPAQGFEVSLLGSSLAVQVQRFITIGAELDAAPASSVDRPVLKELGRRVSESDDLEPYYRCYEAADGYLALACLNLDQRRRVQDLLGIDDPWAANPQSEPVDEEERLLRSSLKSRFAAVLRGRSVAEWIDAFTAAGVPAGPVHDIRDVHASAQAHANGLVQRIHQPGVGELSLLGSIFKVDGATSTARRPAPRLGEHTEAWLHQLSDTTVPEGASRP